ncbi:MAG TPA: hypothetical protein VGR81_07345 [Candidatus Acidoferrales bacterium]|nr:hypothetical protein [Candidatus Acidoferrales bacterium]
MFAASPRHEWRSLRFSDSPIGVASLVPIVFAAIVWPLCVLISEREQSFQLAMEGITAFCYIAFTVGVLASLYSLLSEKSKIFGWAGVAVAAYALFLQPKEWYLGTLIEFYLPLLVFLPFFFMAAHLSEKHHHAAPRV